MYCRDYSSESTATRAIMPFLSECAVLFSYVITVWKRPNIFIPIRITERKVLYYGWYFQHHFEKDPRDWSHSHIFTEA